MSEAQQGHGFIVQKLFEPAFLGWESKNDTEKWDILAEFDKVLGIPTSIKTIKLGGSVDYADAKRIWEIDELYRLLLVTYIQEGDNKKIISVDEYIIKPQLMDTLRGNITYDIVEKFHDTLCSFSREKYKEARIFHRKYQETLTADGYTSEIRLSPKVGERDNQRRLQCSIPRTIFKKHFGDYSYNTKYRGIEFEQSFYSPPKSKDQYYTKDEIAKKCYDILNKKYPISAYDCSLEPSAGTGSFFKLMPKNKEGIDRYPKTDDIVEMNFFDYVPKKGKRYIVLGNPPFGKNSSLAIKFFNHAANFSGVEIIAFILPRTFRKASFHNRLDRNFHLVYDEVLPKNSFIFKGKEYDVPCTFQIWEKRKLKRAKIIEPNNHQDFSFVEKDKGDFSFQRVGNDAGFIREEFSEYATESHYFIEAYKSNVIDIMKGLDFTEIKLNNAGNPSISKREIVRLYSEIVSNDLDTFGFLFD